MAATQQPLGSPVQRYQGVQKESAGYKLMTSMGWREGEGLGAAKQGIKEHIRVKKKFENWGVGAVEAAETARAWTTGMLDFHRVLSTLSEITSQHARSNEDSGSDASDASGGEEEPGPKGKKAKKKAAGKKAKKGVEEKAGKRGKKQAASDPGSSSSGSDASDAEEAAAAAPEPKRAKLATHVGRFKKRENAKSVKNYSAMDLAAILGESGDPFQAAAAALALQARSEPSPAAAQPSGSGSDSDAAPGRRAGAVRGAAPALEPPGTPEDGGEGQWWFGYFHRAQVRVGAGRRPTAKAPTGREADIHIHGFSEQDQTNLYNMAQDTATHGRVGLGRSSMPKKVAGARWVGTKTRIGSDSEGEEEGAGSDDLAEEEAELEVAGEAGGAGGVVIVLPKSQQQRQQQQQQQVVVAGLKPAAADPDAPALAAVKWKKAITAALAGRGEAGLKLDRLVKRVMKERGLGAELREAALASVTKAAQESSKFSLVGGKVRAL